MQVIEKVKVVPEGYNGAGMNYDGGNRRDVNGKANAGLTLGIIGTALGGLALFGNRRSTPASILGGAGGGMLGDGSTNINVLGATAGSGSGAPTAFQAWEKSCEDTLALQGGLYQWALTQQNQRFEDRERLNSELFGVYIDGRADKDGMIDIEGVFDEEMEIINNIDNFDFDIPFIGGGNISKGIISLEIPYVNKIVALNQIDLEVLKESLISLKTK